MKYLKLFEEESLYNNDIGNNPSALLPNVSLITNGDNNIKYNINPIRMATYEPYNNIIQLFKSWNNIKKAYVDGIDLDEMLNIGEHSLVIKPNDIFYSEQLGAEMVNVIATDTFANLKSCSLEIEGELLDTDNVFITIYSTYGGSNFMNIGTISQLVENQQAWLNEDRTILNINPEIFYSAALIDFCCVIARDGVFLETTIHIVGTKLDTRKEYVVNNETLPNIEFEREEILYIAIQAKNPSEITENTSLIGFQNNETYEVLGTLGELLNYSIYHNGTLLVPANGDLPFLLCFTNSDITDICDSTNYIFTTEELNKYLDKEGICIESEHNTNVIFETNNRFKSVEFGTSVKSLNRHALHYVTSIGHSAFSYCSGLESIVIPDSVTSIDTYAFHSCSGLTGELVIPDSVTSIGHSAFSYCSGLESIVIPDSVTSIDSQTFHSCSGLTGELVIPDSVTSIGHSAFSYCSGLESVVIPDSVTNIGSSAFYSCSGLTSIVIPDSVTIINSQTFSYCSGLTGELVIPDSVTSIDSSAFQGCSGLESVEIGSGVTSIGRSAFEGCKGLESVVIPDSVTSIGSRIFENCSGLESVEIGSGVTSIDTYAFQNCSGLTSVVIPDSVTSIGNYTFRYCSGLTEITCLAATAPSIQSNTFNSVKYGGTLYVPAGSDYSSWMSTSSYYLGKYDWFTHEIGVELPELTLDGYDVAMLVQPATTGSTRICYTTSNIAEIKVNDTVLDTIPTLYTFSEFGKWNVVRIKYTDGVTSIPSSCFNSCIRMYEVKIADSVTSIGSSAFEGCKGLTSVVIPDSVTSISEYAFYSCSGLESIVIPDSVTSIGSSVFQGCSGLTSVVIPDSVNSIGDSAFQNCSGLTSVVIPDSVTSIGSSVFQGCSGLESVEIGSGVTSIDTYAFQNCSGLESVVIPDSVTSIDDSAFHSCSGLTGELVIPDSVTSIGRFAFYNCSGLTSIVIPDSVTSIGSSAFHYCKGLESVVIPDSVTSIGDSQTFSYCSGLESVEIGSGVTSIGNSAFYNCSGLTEITCLAATAPSIQSDTFKNVKSDGTLYVPAGSDYSSWTSTLSGWVIQYIY